MIEVIVNVGEVSAEHGDLDDARPLLLQAADMAAARDDDRTELRPPVGWTRGNARAE